MIILRVRQRAMSAAAAERKDAQAMRPEITLKYGRDPLISKRIFLDQRRAREQADRKAAMASAADGRIIRPRPEPDGELLPIVTFLDQTLASDLREEPPMRDASGNLVEVRVREPWDFHLLTADGTNAAADDTETLKAPPEPGLMLLTPICVELLVRRLSPLARAEGQNQLFCRSAPAIRGCPEGSIRRVTFRSSGRSIRHRSSRCRATLLMASDWIGTPALCIASIRPPVVPAG